MGKPKSIQAAKVPETYNWGEFGAADSSGVNFNPTMTSNIQSAQSGISQYLNELINPSYDNESFRARQDLFDASNQQYAKQLGAEAIARGARGSATQNILNSIAANRNIDMRQAMTQEDARVQNILNALSGIEGNYFNMGNTMANNILQRATSNQSAQQQANIANAQAYNQWKNNLISGGASIAGALGGVGLASALSPATTSLLKGGYAIDPMQVASANNWIQ